MESTETSFCFRLGYWNGAENLISDADYGT